jgi:hypothetical protein
MVDLFNITLALIDFSEELSHWTERTERTQAVHHF